MKKNNGNPIWPIVITAAVSILSLGLNGVQFYSNLALERAKAITEQQLGTLEIEKQRLENLARKRELSVNLETRLFVISGEGLTGLSNPSFLDTDQHTSIGVTQSSVYRQLQDQGWLERWDIGGDIIFDDEGKKMAHAVVFLKVTNIGSRDAQKVKLIVKQKSFSLEGDHDVPFWELSTHTWEASEIRLADLKASQSVLVPVAHILGTSTYFGPVIVAKELEWFNPTLEKEGNTEVTKMAPEDQWISQGLNISVAQ